MASDTVYVGQLICDSTTPPPDRGFYKINDTTTGHVGKHSKPEKPWSDWPLL